MKRAERGSGLIIVILVISFLLTVGIAVMTVTSTGPKVAGNVRNQEEAFNAAEAGFEASRKAIDNYINEGIWESFADHCLREPTGIDLPFIATVINPDYFRRRSDEELLTMILPYKDDIDKVLFYNQPFVRNAAGGDDLRYTYTSFLIDDEAAGGTADPGDVLLVCIGVVRAGNTILSTARLEIVFAMQVL